MGGGTGGGNSNISLFMCVFRERVSVFEKSESVFWNKVGARFTHSLPGFRVFRLFRTDWNVAESKAGDVDKVSTRVGDTCETETSIILACEE